MLKLHRLSTPKNYALALAAAGGCAALGAGLGSLQAQITTSGLDAAAMELPLAEAAREGFTLSSQAQFEEAFAHLDGQLAAPQVAPGAVDITTIEPAEPQTQSLGRGVASYYGRRFHGRLTANGERFDMHAMTAAHKTLPFGTRLRITNPRNGKSVTVRINDRGPYIAGREIDLSRGAAERIGMIQSGHASVEIERLTD